MPRLFRDPLPLPSPLNSFQRTREYNVSQSYILMNMLSKTPKLVVLLILTIEIKYPLSLLHQIPAIYFYHEYSHPCQEESGTD